MHDVNGDRSRWKTTHTNGASKRGRRPTTRAGSARRWWQVASRRTSRYFREKPVRLSTRRPSGQKRLTARRLPVPRKRPIVEQPPKIWRPGTGRVLPEAQQQPRCDKGRGGLVAVSPAAAAGMYLLLPSPSPMALEVGASKKPPPPCRQRVLTGCSSRRGVAAEAPAAQGVDEGVS